MSVDSMTSRICGVVDQVFEDWKPENLEPGTFVRKRLFTIGLLLKMWTVSALEGGRLGDEAVLGEAWHRRLFSLGKIA
jgi:hypothetical protein